MRTAFANLIMMNKALLSIVFVSVAALVAACGSDAAEEPVAPAKPPVQVQYTDTLRVLAIGNSYTIDAFAMLPFVLTRVVPDTYIVVAILYSGGVDLAWHLTAFSTNRAYQAYYKWTTAGGTWSRMEFSTPDRVLADEQWDCVTLQQVSTMSHDYATISPYLRPLVDLLRDKGYHRSMAWIITPAYPDGLSRLVDGTLRQGGQAVSYTSDQMMEAIGKTARQVMQSGCCDKVMPCGTALQNARHTALNSYGDWGQMTQDGIHLQSGIGMYVEACAAAMALQEKPFTACRISTHLSDYQLLSRGREVGMDFSNQDLAVACAAMAYTSPYSVTL